MDDETGAVLAEIRAATGRLLARIAGLTDAQAREPSLLPGWSRGHVLTHIARNAGGLASVARWARTGTGTPMYASDASRAADIEAGAARPASALVADVRESAAAFAREAELVPADAWSTLVRRTPGSPPFPAREALTRRLGEVELHHADLCLGYGWQDWPQEFVQASFPRVAGSWAGRADAPPCWISTPGGGMLPVGAAGEGGPASRCPVVTGPLPCLLAWLTGRSRGEGLTVEPAGRLPPLPVWA
jgi:maleylpyruvate isomerase